MNDKPQVIFDNGKPVFIVLRYEDYLMLSGRNSRTHSTDAEFVPFVLSDYISNPIRLARIEAGFNQQQLAKLLNVTQGYVSRIESRAFRVSDQLLKKVKAAIANRQKKNRKKVS